MFLIVLTSSEPWLTEDRFVGGTTVTVNKTKTLNPDTAFKLLRFSLDYFHVCGR